ncbi:hypothetical protein CONLIGDRAFT_480163 [Coniochaeta ligniaria NRRL 30616]|uniref:Microbial-type PARG catalytic domain-containing protein n=1 Tax=Coniochaeta ligniaria NRRL 30616 TaxID=1408157 RepID=A0A1J7IFT9_9PEZI|nr:hypothetical protein CONLIGDRAFT_480163 [Coniochaeta ligniaria NRRL 30616]
MPGSSKQSPKPKPSEIAADTKRNVLPFIKAEYADVTSSYLVAHPITQIEELGDRPTSLSHPTFFVRSGDPVDLALGWQVEKDIFIPVICAANDKRPGGDWETGVQGYEERLCRRSSLAATLATPAQDSRSPVNFPIPSTGAIYSPCVFVFRGPQYEPIDFEQWVKNKLPIVSVPPSRWPKLVPDGTKYSFRDERAMVKDKIRGALRICAYNGHEYVVISGDWGLGNGHRNPPRELAEVWREVLLYDPDLRGRIREVAFVFEDASQCTAQMIITEMSKKDSKKSGKGKEGGGGKGKGAAGASCGQFQPTDAQIFTAVFDEGEIRRVLEQPDARYGLDNLLTK